jgi:hypothetical protein
VNSLAEHFHLRFLVDHDKDSLSSLVGKKSKEESDKESKEEEKEEEREEEESPNSDDEFDDFFLMYFFIFYGVPFKGYVKVHWG